MKTLGIIEDDPIFREAIAGEFEDRGYAVTAFESLGALRAARDFSPDFAIVDLKLKGESGLDAVEHLQRAAPHCQTVVLTGYGSIATAVQAVKRGAINYIAKPASVDVIERAFHGQTLEESEAGDEHNLYRHEREYIEKVIQDCEGNITKAARVLGIHRQSLQRKLRKFSPIA